MYVPKVFQHIHVCQGSLPALLLGNGYGLVLQMGNQGHSEANYFQFKAWKEAGIIKDVTAITAHMNSARRWHGWDVNMKDFPRAETVPATLDWDCWQGARPQRSYNHDFINGQWLCWLSMPSYQVMSNAGIFLRFGNRKQIVDDIGKKKELCPDSLTGFTS